MFVEWGNGETSVLKFAFHGEENAKYGNFNTKIDFKNLKTFFILKILKNLFDHQEKSHIGQFKVKSTDTSFRAKNMRCNSSKKHRLDVQLELEKGNQRNFIHLFFKHSHSVHHPKAINILE